MSPNFVPLEGKAEADFSPAPKCAHPIEARERDVLGRLICTQCQHVIQVVFGEVQALEPVKE